MDSGNPAKERQLVNLTPKKKTGYDYFVIWLAPNNTNKDWPLNAGYLCRTDRGINEPIYGRGKLDDKDIKRYRYYKMVLNEWLDLANHGYRSKIIGIRHDKPRDNIMYF